MDFIYPPPPQGVSQTEWDKIPIAARAPQGIPLQLWLEMRQTYGEIIEHNKYVRENCASDAKALL